MNIKALTLWQPHASLVAVGAKTNETRSWATSYRGPLAIHAARKWNRELRALCLEEPFWTVLRAQPCFEPRAWDATLGCVLAVCDLVDCVPVERIRDSLSEQEEEFGDYSDGRWAWVLRNVRRLPKPIQASGMQGLWAWAWPDAVLEVSA